MTDIFDQYGLEDELPADEAGMEQGYADYSKIYGNLPPEADDVSVEQWCGVRALLASSRIFVDLATFGPYSSRTQRQLKTSGLIINTEGQLQRDEPNGPATFDAWEECWKTFRTVIIMTSTATQSAVDGYAALIKRYHQRYGQRCWKMIYQSDVRWRRERCLRVKREGEIALATATAAGGVHPYDPGRPWEWILKQASADGDWWRKELEDQCLLILAGAQGADSQLGDDAPVQTQGGGASNDTRKRATLHDGATRGGGDPPLRGPKKGKPTPQDRVHEVDENGYYLRNRSGAELCHGYQTGDCTEGTGANSLICKRNAQRRHQCNRCLGHHPGSECKVEASKNLSKKGKGKGAKGKGARKGKYR